MAYISPNSTVEFFADLGLSRDDTLYFATATAKNNYFASIQKIATEDALSYVSRERGVIRSSLAMSTAINIGYMRYKNTSFENFWFYAYVTDVEYTNNGLTEIHFTIDNMMTYMGIFTLGECFVERQHVLNDAIGANLCDERLEYGDYKYRKITKSGTMKDMLIAVQASVTATGDQAPGILINNIYSGCAIYTFSTADEVESYLEKLTDSQKSDAILSMYMTPKHYNTLSITRDSVVIDKPYTDIDGYVPKNNKLFIYPYNYLTVTNLDGNFGNFRYEFFSGTAAYFTLEGCLSSNPSVVLAPIFYKGVEKNYSEKMVISNFPSCAYTIDTYRAYLAQNRSNLAIDALSSLSSGELRAVSQSTGLLSLIPINATSSILSKVSNVTEEMYKYSQKPAQSGGNQGADTLVNLGEKDFVFIQKNITRNYAEMIDNYFDMFGYAVRQHLVPNMNARPNWTFCKTVGCTVRGKMPSSAARDIENMFDSGVRFWKDHNNIGNYSLNNSPA